MKFNPDNLFSACILTCDRVLREADDVMSAIRIVDFHHVPESILNDGLKLKINALTIMKTREQSGEHLFTMEVEFPDSSTRQVLAIEDGEPLRIAFSSKSELPGSLFGAQVLIQINLETKLPGSYKLRTLLDGQKIAETVIMLHVRRSE